MGVLNKTTAELNYHLINARAVLNVSQPETIIGDDVYHSPSQYVQEIAGFTENFTYAGGALTYNGPGTIKIKIQSVITLSTGSANNLITMTCGLNATPEANFEIQNKLVNSNDVKELSHQGFHSIANGQSVNFFVKATSDVVIEKAVFSVMKID